MKISKHSVQMISGFLGMLLLLTPLTLLAQTKVVVIPLGDDAKPLRNIITVAKANGNFTDPVAAVNSIADASATNPYLVVIGPGVYPITQTLQMKEYVDITGSGENVTKLTGAISTGDFASSAIISGVTNSVLSSLTVENTGGNGFSVALYNGNVSPTVSNVTATALGGNQCFGVYNSSSSPMMRDVTARGSGSSESYGVWNSYSSPTMTNVNATGSGGTIANIGVYNDSSSSPTMTSVSARGSDFGVYNYSSSLKMRRSTIEGGALSLYTYDGTATISQSTLIGGVDFGSSGSNKCVACDDGSGKALDANCQPPP